MRYLTFSEYVEQRSTGDRSAPSLVDEPGFGRGDVCERSLFRGVFKAVNPARPASPTNSRLLASPFRKKLKSQVVGR